MVSNDELLALSKRLRMKSAIVLDVDPDFSADLYLAACLIDDLHDARVSANVWATK